MYCQPSPRVDQRFHDFLLGCDGILEFIFSSKRSPVGDVYLNRIIWRVALGEFVMGFRSSFAPFSMFSRMSLALSRSESEPNQHVVPDGEGIQLVCQNGRPIPKSSVLTSVPSFTFSKVWKSPLTRCSREPHPIDRYHPR